MCFQDHQPSMFPDWLNGAAFSLKRQAAEHHGWRCREAQMEGFWWQLVLTNDQICLAACLRKLGLWTCCGSTCSQSVCNSSMSWLASGRHCLAVDHLLLRCDAGHAWMTDYGNPSKPQDFEVLYSYSPLHNVKQPREGLQYPAMLLLTGRQAGQPTTCAAVLS